MNARLLAFTAGAVAVIALAACDPPRSSSEGPRSKVASAEPGRPAASDRGAVSNTPVGAASSPGMSATVNPGELGAIATEKQPSGEKGSVAPRKPLAASGPFIELPIEGHPAAVVSVPLGATSLRPVVLATHGNYDRPAWQCQVWRDIVGPSAFILCPRGVARRDSPGPDDIRFTYEDNVALEREVRAGLAALRSQFPDHVDPGPILYTGFSLGAITGVRIMGRGPALFPRAVLVEGGHDVWTVAAASAYAKAGGLRVLFACGQPGCVAAAKRPAALLEKAGVKTRVVHGKGIGHGYHGAVADEVKRSFEWVVEGDSRFQAP